MALQLTLHYNRMWPCAIHNRAEWINTYCGLPLNKLKVMSPQIIMIGCHKNDDIISGPVIHIKFAIITP